MYIPNYEITKGKLFLLICDLASGEEDVKKRVVNVFSERYIHYQEFPEKFRDEWESIHKFLTYKGATKDENAYIRTAFRKGKKTYKKIVVQLIRLYIEFEIYLEEQQ